MARTFTTEDVLKIITKMVSEATSLREVAREVGMSPAYLSDITLGRRGISAEVAKKFGFERIVKTEVFFTKVGR